MTRFYLRLIGICLLVNLCSAASTHGNGRVSSSDFHKHSDSDLDVVQCHHAVFRVPQNGGKPELVNGQESRVNARQYLPPPGSPGPPTKEEDPAASFDQPKFLSVENTFVSPTLQKNYNTLFSQNKPDVSPAAAQNVLSSVVPDSPRKVNDKKHSHDHDDEDNLERLCNDAFHSFLCKPIKGPRKTPTGRLRENAVLPPGVFSGQASFQDVSRVRPDDRPTSSSNNVRISVTKPTPKSPPIQSSPSIGYLPQRVSFPQSYTTTQRTTTTTTVIPFTNIYKPEKPVFPSPSNNNQQYITPPHDCEKSKGTTPPFISNPTNQNPAFLKLYTPSTPKPLNKGYNIPIIPFPSNNSPNIALPPRSQTTQQQHDCDKPKITSPTLIPNPTNQNPSFLKPYNPPTPKPFKQDYNIPIIPYPSNNAPNIAIPPKPKSLPPPPLYTSPPHNCDQHRTTFTPLFGNPTNQSPATFKPLPTFRPIEISKVPEASNNIAQIIGQPQQLSRVSVSPPKSSGYVYEKPAIPFPPPPTAPRPFPPTTPQPTTGYVYDPPRIPFASNNAAQVVKLPTAKQTAKPTCDHDHPTGELTNPTNQNVVVLTPGPSGDAYTYNKPAVPFPPETSGPTNQNSVSLSPFVTTTQEPVTGYSYQRPVKQLLLPAPTNTFQRIASPANNGYNYQKPERPFPPQSNLPSNNNQVFVAQSTFKPFPTTSKPFNGYSYDQPSVPFPNINSKLSLPSETKPQYLAKAQSREEVTVRPGYSYNKPSVPFSAVSGYTYRKPSPPFPR